MLNQLEMCEGMIGSDDLSPESVVRAEEQFHKYEAQHPEWQLELRYAGEFMAPPWLLGRYQWNIIRYYSDAT